MKPIEAIYLMPSDRAFNPRYKNAIKDVLAEVQLWFYGALGGRSFLFTDVISISSRIPSNDFDKPLPGREPPVFYRAFDEVNRVRGIAPNGLARIIFVDAPGRTGSGDKGICVLPYHDLEALLTPSKNRGGIAHEVGHLLGLNHSGESEPNALMLRGYGKLPFTYLTVDDRKTLSNCPYLVKMSPSERVLQRPIYCYSEGRFVVEKGQWYEIFCKNGSQIAFQEVSKDGTYRYLKDPTRDLTLRLPEKGGWVYWTTPREGAWRALYEVLR
jgi:hypothetical protein